MPTSYHNIHCLVLSGWRALTVAKFTNLLSESSLQWTHAIFRDSGSCRYKVKKNNMINLFIYSANIDWTFPMCQALNMGAFNGDQNGIASSHGLKFSERYWQVKRQLHMSNKSCHQRC